MGYSEDGRRPSVWILILLLLALMGVSLVHEPDAETAGDGFHRPAGFDQGIADHGPPPGRREARKFKKDGGT